MKTFFALLVAGMFALPVFAQQNFTTTPLYRADARPVSGAKALPTATLDTLTQYLDRASNNQVTVYPFTDQNENEWPVTGTNPLYFALGARYTIEGTASIKGLLIAYAGKNIQGEADSLIAWIFSQGENGLPSTAIGGAVYTSDNIVTSTTNVVLTYVGFPEPVVTTGSFTAMVRTVGFYTANPPDPTDITAIFSNQQGDGNGEDKAVFLAVQNGDVVTNFLSNLFTTPLDIDPIIMPVIETTTTDVGEAITHNGLSLHGAFPNPASDRSTIRFSLEKPSFVEISLLDMTGKTMLTIRRDNLGAGEQALDLNVADIPAGSYLYTVRTASSALAGKMTVVK